MEIIRLKGKSLNGKQKINKFGEDWILAVRREVVSFSMERNWVLIFPISNEEKVRWIQEKNDWDFEIVK